MVTKALDPNPPLRHDCDEIFRPSTGAGCSGAIASAVAGSKERPSFAKPTVTSGAWVAAAVASCSGLPPCWFADVAEQQPSPNSDDHHNRQPANGYPDVACGHSLRMARKTVAREAHEACRFDVKSFPHCRALLRRANRTYCTAQQKSRAGVTPHGSNYDCRLRGSADGSSIRETQNSCIKTRQKSYASRDSRPVGSSKGIAMPEPGR